MCNRAAQGRHVVAVKCQYLGRGLKACKHACKPLSSLAFMNANNISSRDTDISMRCLLFGASFCQPPKIQGNVMIVTDFGNLCINLVSIH